MTYNFQRPLSDMMAVSFNPVGGTPSGSKTYAVAPI